MSEETKKTQSTNKGTDKRTKEGADKSTKEGADKSVNKGTRRIYILLVVAAIIVAVGMYSVVINSYVQEKTKERIVFDLTDNEAAISEEAMAELKALDPECIIVMGCAVKEDGTPSDMLRDRLDAGIALYRQGIAPKILLTGDNGQEEYNEIHAMLTYTLAQGIPPEDIFCDHAGFSTSESMIRADTIFSISRAVVVTQRYHEYRTIYNASKMGIDVLGVSAAQSKFKNQAYHEIRELLARNKDFLLFNILNPTAVGGEKIDISGDGTISHGE